MKKNPYIFYLAESMHTDLKEKSAETGIPMSTLITQAFLDWIKSRQAARKAAQNGGDRHDE